MVIGVAGVDLPEGPCAVDRFEEIQIQDVQDVLVLRVRVDVVEIGRALPKRTILVDFRPCGTAIVGPEDAAAIGFDDRVDAIGI